MLARRPRSSKLSLARAIGMATLWMVPLACLHRTGNRASCGFVASKCRWLAVPHFATPRECQTCSIFTPSSFWRWRYSFSCGFAACSASAPAASGRLTTRIRRAMPCAARRTTRSLRCRRDRPEASTPPWRRPRRRPTAGRASPKRVGVAPGLDAIAAADKSFDAKHFITGARTAYEMIVTAFAEGDRRQLRSLLSREVYRWLRRGDQRARRPRRDRGDPFRLDRWLDDHRRRTARPDGQITLRFVSKLVSATRDRNGNVIDGNAEKVTGVTDVWTFARDVSSRDPNWKLVATEAGGDRKASALPVRDPCSLAGRSRKRGGAPQRRARAGR